MNTVEYKQICSRPGVMRRSTLDATRQAIKAEAPEGYAAICSILGGTAIPKPDSYSGTIDDEFFEVVLDDAIVHDIIDVLGTREAGAVSPKGETTTLASRYGSLLDEWLTNFP